MTRLKSDKEIIKDLEEKIKEFSEQSIIDVDKGNIDKAKKNILLAHEFYKIIKYNTKLDKIYTKAFNHYLAKTTPA